MSDAVVFFFANALSTQLLKHVIFFPLFRFKQQLYANRTITTKQKKEEKRNTQNCDRYIILFICNGFGCLAFFHTSLLFGQRRLCIRCKQQRSLRKVKEHWMNCVNKSCSELRSLSYFSLTHASIIIEMQMYMILPFLFIFVFVLSLVFFSLSSQNQHSAIISMYSTSTFRIAILLSFSATLCHSVYILLIAMW